MTIPGFIKVAAAVPSVRVADCSYNIAQMTALIGEAVQKKVDIVAFPELSVTGYTCGDLFGQKLLLDGAADALQSLVEQTSNLPILCVAGLPWVVNNRLYNVAVVFGQGKIYGMVPKTYLPNYNEFYEMRWFVSGADCPVQQVDFRGEVVPFGTDLLFENEALCFGVEVCEDLWVPIPPSSEMALQRATLLVNISASNEMAGKHDYLRSLIRQQSARTMSAYLYVSAGFGESTTDLVFAGNGLIAENGTILKESDRFSFEPQLTVCDVDVERMDALRRKENTFTKAGKAERRFRTIGVASFPGGDRPIDRNIDAYPFIPSEGQLMDERCNEIFNIQVNSLSQRLLHTHSQTAVIGISGGLDSTLALLVCVKTFDKLKIPRRQILGITMPGFGTTDRTYQNALNLMAALGITTREISIVPACLQHFQDIGLNPDDRGAAYENTQARERTQILMDVANQTNGLVVGTGDLSELALGWATYNGDHMSMYGVNSSIPKTLVRYLVKWVADKNDDAAARKYLLDIIDTPISPELLPADENGQIAQKTEDLVGPYELHDFFLYYFIRFGFRPTKIFQLATLAFEGIYDSQTIQKWLKTFYRRFFSQQFKRSALPDGPKVGSVSLSPRGDWRMPSDATVTAWMQEVESL